VTLPVDNVSINGAFTVNALVTTPLTPGVDQIYSRVLLPTMSQVTAMAARDPTIVSVELGSNEMLSGLAGVSPLLFFDEGTWEGLYDQVVGAVHLKTNKAVVVGLINDLRHVPGIRTGDEIWADQAEFTAFHVAVQPNCQGSKSVIYVLPSVAVAAAAGLASAQHGGPFIPFSCAPSPNLLAQDFILSKDEADAVNKQMQIMSGHIQTDAQLLGFAYFDLGTLYDRSDIKGPFSLTKLMTSFTPFGPYFSADGIHPNGAGQTILARAAAQALNNKYGLGIPLP
jgi:hypothetical protein